MTDVHKRAQRHLDDTQDAVDRANTSQAERERAGDDPRKRADARERQYLRDTRAAVSRDLRT